MQRRSWPGSWRTYGSSLGLAVLLAAVLAGPALARSASTWQEKFQGGEQIVIATGSPVQHDLYVAGSRVRIEDRIEGDLFVAGGEVTVNGPVQGDLFLAGGQVAVVGAVQGDLRIAGGSVTVSGAVAEDALVMAGQFQLTSGGRVGQDLLIGTGQTQLDGAVAGSVVGSTSGYARTGTVGGAEQVRIEEPPEAAPPPTVADQILDQVRRFISLTLVGGLLAALFPRVALAAETLVRERPLHSLLAGLIGWAGLVIGSLGLGLAALLLAVPLALVGLGQVAALVAFTALVLLLVLTLLFAVIALYLANAVVGLALGRLVLKNATGRWAAGIWPPLLLGTLLVVLLTALPVLGGVLNVISVLVGFGAMLLTARRLLQAPTPATNGAPAQPAQAEPASVQVGQPAGPGSRG